MDVFKMQLIAIIAFVMFFVSSINADTIDDYFTIGNHPSYNPKTAVNSFGEFYALHIENGTLILSKFSSTGNLVYRDDGLIDANSYNYNIAINDKNQILIVFAATIDKYGLYGLMIDRDFTNSDVFRIDDFEYDEDYIYSNIKLECINNNFVVAYSYVSFNISNAKHFKNFVVIDDDTKTVTDQVTYNVYLSSFDYAFPLGLVDITKVSDSTFAIGWNNQLNFILQYFNTSGSTISDEIIIDDSRPYHYVGVKHLADNTLFVFPKYTAGSKLRLFGRFIDSDYNVSSRFAISDTIISNPHPLININSENEKYFGVVWADNRSLDGWIEEAIILKQMITQNGEKPIPNEILFSEPPSRQQHTRIYNSNLSLSNEKAFIVWDYFSSGMEQVKGAFFDWNQSTTGISTPNEVITKGFRLNQNYPNPFNPSTEIRYALPNSIVVNISIYDISGRKISTLVNTTKTAGEHVVKWDGTNSIGERVPGGVYLYRLQTENFSETRKMILIK